MKDVIVAGDTLDDSYTVEGYTPSEGWIFHLRLIPQSADSGLTPIPLTAITDPDAADAYRVQVGPSITAEWGAGYYTLTRWIQKAGARYSCETRPELPVQVRILPDPAVVAVYDGRSDAKRALDAAMAARNAAGSREHVEYEINGRRVVFEKRGDLLVHIDALKREVANEERAAKLAAGLGNPRHLYIRFGQS